MKIASSARHRQDGVERRHRLDRLDHGEGERRTVGAGEIGLRVAAVQLKRAGGAPAPLADRRIFDRGDEGLGIGDRIDHRRDHGRGAHASSARLAKAKSPTGTRTTAGLPTSAAAPMPAHDADGVMQPVLHVERHAVEAGAGRALGEQRLGNRDPGGQEPGGRVPGSRRA